MQRNRGSAVSHDASERSTIEELRLSGALFFI